MCDNIRREHHTMDTSTDKQLRITSPWTMFGVALLLVALACITFYTRGLWLAKQHQKATSRMPEGNSSGELVVDADATADCRAKGVMDVNDVDSSTQPLSEREKAELLSAVSNMVSAYSNQDARAVRQHSANVLDFMDSKKHQVSAEMSAQTLEPIKRVLLDHFRVRKLCGDFNTAEELDAHFALDMEILSFVFEASLKRDLTIIDDSFELIALESAVNARRIYEQDSRNDMAAICVKWIGKWKERIDSEDGYARIKLKRSYLRDIKYWQNVRKSGSTGTYLTDEDIRSECYHAVELRGRLHGYTPKWISEYAPTEPKTR